jgi:aromatic ring-opening dioxygenase catalytic subunit (LigB family)
MPLGLGLACSHAPNVFVKPENWEARYKMAIADVPQPLAAQQETAEVKQAFAARIEAGFDVLRRQVEAYRPDTIIMVSDDHNEMYDEKKCQPNLAMFVGETGMGFLGLRAPGADPNATPDVTVKCNPELGEFIAKGLVQRNFDLTVTRTKETHSIGPVDRGMGHGFTRTAPKIMPALDIPTVLIWLNCYFEPLPTARRCLDLGRALADICSQREEKIAILGTGGLSHDPRGPRAGWIDEPLDRSVLKALADGDPDRLSALFSFDSDTFHGGTGEIRNWLVVGGAMGSRKATVVDYMAVHHAITGVGFAYWNASAPDRK